MALRAGLVRSVCAVPVACALVAASCHGADRYARQPSGQDGGPIDSRGDAAGRDGPPGGNDGGGGGPGTDVGDGLSDADGPSVRDLPCGACKLTATYACFGPDTNQIRAAFKVVNKTAEEVPMEQITFRYWYTDLGGSAQEFVCDYADVGTSLIEHRFVTVDPPGQGADTFVEIGFAPGAHTLKPFGDTGEIRVRVSRADKQTISQGDDYSFDCSTASFTEWSRVTVYVRGVLVGGIEPPDKTAAPPP